MPSRVAVPSSLDTPSKLSMSDASVRSHPPDHYLPTDPTPTPPSPSATSDIPTPSHPHGFRAQLTHLLPRHAYFHARVQIQQINNVPLVSGDFGVKWRFKNAHTMPGSKTAKQGLLGIVTGRSKGKGKAGEEGDYLTYGTTVDDSRLSIPSVVVSTHSSSSSSSRSTSYASSKGPPSPTSSVNSRNSHLTSDWSSSNTPPSPTTSASTTPTASTASTPSPSIALPSPATLGADSYSPSRGITPFLPLKDHAVVWNHTLNIVLKIDIDRSTGVLLSNPLKLVVTQPPTPEPLHPHSHAGQPHHHGHSSAPSNRRLGALHLNLAEYVDKGEVSRRYLLSESKVNATLKLTINIHHLSGSTAYTAPALPTNEILNGIASILQTRSDVYRTRPKVLDLYGPYGDQRDLELDLLGECDPAFPRVESESEGEGSERGGKRRGTIMQRDREGAGGRGVPFDVERLPMAYGPKTTETLIEAIFNPVRVGERRRESPFTYYVPEERAGGKGMPLRGASPSPSVSTSTSMSTSTSRGLGVAGRDVEVASVYSGRSVGSSVTGGGSTGTRGTEDGYAHSGGYEPSVRTTGSGASGSTGTGTSGSSGSGSGDRSVHYREEDGDTKGGVKGWWKKMANPQSVR